MITTPLPEVIHFNPDGTGEWRLLDLSSPLDPNPDFLDPKPFIPPFAKTLAACYASQGAALCDAYQAANAKQYVAVVATDTLVVYALP